MGGCGVSAVAVAKEINDLIMCLSPFWQSPPVEDDSCGVAAGAARIKVR